MENALQSTTRHMGPTLRRLAGPPKKWASSQPPHIPATSSLTGDVSAEMKCQGYQALLGDGGREEEDGNGELKGKAGTELGVFQTRSSKSG